MARTKKPKLVAMLPATPCTPEMRKEVEDYVTSAGMSFAELHRAAIELFLRRSDSIAITLDTLAIEKMEAEPS